MFTTSAGPSGMKGTQEVQALFDLAFVIANLLPTYCHLKAGLCRQKVVRSQSWHSGYLVSLLQSCWPTLAPSLLSATSAVRLGEGIMADQDPVATQAQAARSQAGLVKHGTWELTQLTEQDVALLSIL